MSPAFTEHSPPKQRAFPCIDTPVRLSCLKDTCPSTRGGFWTSSLVYLATFLPYSTLRNVSSIVTKTCFGSHIYPTNIYQGTYYIWSIVNPSMKKTQDFLTFWGEYSVGEALVRNALACAGKDWRVTRWWGGKGRRGFTQVGVVWKVAVETVYILECLTHVPTVPTRYRHSRNWFVSNSQSSPCP